MPAKKVVKQGHFEGGHFLVLQNTKSFQQNARRDPLMDIS
jgi:surfactin synthase thioesterase subunit